MRGGHIQWQRTGSTYARAMPASLDGEVLFFSVVTEQGSA